MSFSFKSQGGTPDDFGDFKNPSKNQANISFVTKTGGDYGAGKSKLANDIANISISPVTTYNPNINGDPNSVPNSIGRRLLNPLGYFASYTYNISLYMLSADAYAAFLATGRTSIQSFDNLSNLANASSYITGNGGGAFLVAQSGGINREVQNRAPGMPLDYYNMRYHLT
jgi:hypothetical protein